MKTTKSTKEDEEEEEQAVEAKAKMRRLQEGYELSGRGGKESGDKNCGVEGTEEEQREGRGKRQMVGGEEEEESGVGGKTSTEKSTAAIFCWRKSQNVLHFKLK